MFVAMSTFCVANSLEEEVYQAFVRRPHQVDSVQGFIRMDVVRAEEDPREFTLITYWTDKESFVTWHKSPQHKLSHEGIPSGLKLVPQKTRVRYFEHVTS